MTDLSTLAAAVAAGTIRSIAEAAAELLGGAWIGEADGWQPAGGTASASPPASATILEDGGYRLATATHDPVVHDLLVAGMSRLAAVDGRRAAESRLNLNERIAGMGSYDWNILADTNDWSDELYAIYGQRAGEFHASYENFLSLVHPDDRDRIRAVHEQAYATGDPYEMEEHIVRPDGAVRTLWSNGAVIKDDEGTPVRMVGVCRDITDERAAELLAAEQHDRIRNAELLRQQALELNDNVVQGLAAAIWAIDGETPNVARNIVTETLEQARTMMHELLSASGSPAEPGALVRAEAASLSFGFEPPDPPEQPGTDRVRVVIADDSEDLREMLRLSLELGGEVEVVAEAEDGQAAVDAVARTAADVVLLDLSMPKMDGLEACSLIRATNPTVRIIVLSGWGKATMGAQAFAAGADAYLQKGASIAEIVVAILDDREFAA